MSPRIANDLFVQWVDDEAVVLNSGSGTLHYLNRSAALVYALIEEFGYERGIVELKSRVEDVDQLENDLPDLLAQMIEDGILLTEE